MQCLYCGKALNLLRELADSEFCSRDHQQRYKRLTARAFSRLLETQPTTPPRLPPEHLSFCRLPPPEPASAAPRRRGVVGPCVASTVDLALPGFVQGTLRFAPIFAGAAPASGPAPARRVAVEFAEANPLAFARGISSDALREPRLLTVDESLGALAKALSHSPSLAPRALGSPVRTADATHTPVTEVLAQPLTPEVRLPPATLAAVEVGSHLGLAEFRTSAPMALSVAPKTAGAPVPLPPSTRLGMPVRAALDVFTPDTAGLLPLGMPEAALAGSMMMTASEPLPCLHAPPVRRPELTASPDCGAYRLEGAVAEEVLCADVVGCPVNEPAAPCPVSSSGLPALASLRLSTPDPAGLLPLGMPEAALAGTMMRTASEPLPCHPDPLVRRPKLTAAANSLALRLKGAVAEEVFGADVVDRPAGMPVTPSLASGSVLPALASLFRYGRLARPATPLPHMTEGVNPRNRLAQPAAYMELPMPVQHPAVPRSSGLRIVETFEYLKPLEEPPFDLLRSLVRVWRATPVYLRYATVSACVILLFWAYIPRGGIAQAGRIALGPDRSKHRGTGRRRVGRGLPGTAWRPGRDPATGRGPGGSARRATCGLAGWLCISPPCRCGTTTWSS